MNGEFLINDFNIVSNLLAGVIAIWVGIAFKRCRKPMLVSSFLLFANASAFLRHEVLLASLLQIAALLVIYGTIGRSRRR
jgi:hypothetical protein